MTQPVPHHCAERKKGKINRLNRISGQIQGIARMVEEERYCIDILQQVQAVRAALARAEAEILRDHADHCVAEAIASGDAEQQRAKIDELIALAIRAPR